MIFLWIFLAVVSLLGGFALWQWWRDEQEKLGKFVREPVQAPSGKALPTVVSPTNVLHPSIDPYLAELRAYLLTDPLPRGPGDMANRVYAHLNEWLNNHAINGSTYDDFEFIDVENVEQQDNFNGI